MLRRALSSFVPAFLALAFLCGTPATSIGGQEASATAWNFGASSSPITRGNLAQDVPGGALKQSADEDDSPDDRIVRTVTDDEDSSDRVVRLIIAVIWPASELDAPSTDTSGVAGPTHRPCAAPPRAPPIA
jgi:hypothetical protein